MEEAAIQSLTKLFLRNGDQATKKKFMLSCVAASCGTSLARWAYSIPGASSTICGINLPYHKHEVLNLLRPIAPPTVLKTNQGFCSASLASLFSTAAKKSSVEAVSADVGPDGMAEVVVVGIGATAVIATNKKHRGGDRCFICVQDSNARKLEYVVRFDGEEELTRREQEEICSYLALNAFFDMVNLFENDTENILFKALEEFKIAGISVFTPSLENIKEELNPKERILKEIISGERTHYLFAPNKSFSQMPVDYPFGADQSFYKNPYAVVTLGGSFNPLHLGHEDILNFAEQLVLRIKESEGVANCKIVKMFEMSVRNPDKGAISMETVNQRMGQFVKTEKGDSEEHFHNFNNRDGPYNVVVMNESYSLFVAKSSILKDAFMVLGYDTAIRLIDKKYYSNSEDEMVKNMLEIKKNGVSLIVVGRVNSSSGKFDDFQSIKESLNVLIRDMFIVVAEDEFRRDISSSQVRQNITLRSKT